MGAANARNAKIARDHKFVTFDASHDSNKNESVITIATYVCTHTKRIQKKAIKYYILGEYVPSAAFL